ncbi:MAG TPA: HIT family protein [Candidatus Pacearchaeota archaeon]|nr:HIT family protein [Candidatus Pacearchaeota archaeon]
MENCIFCKILKQEIPCFKIWEDEKHLAFLDVNPVNPGHTLVVPKKHEDYLFDLSDKEYTELMLAAKNVAKILKKRISCKRVGVGVEGFGVSHAHIHLVPINKAKELNPEKAKPMDKEKLKEIQNKLTS